MLKSQGRLLTPSILLGTIIWASVVLTASAEPTNCVPVPSGLAGWWAGEGNAHDNLGGNNGALYGSMSFGAGKVGQAFNFDGSSGYVEMPAPASLNVGAGAGLTFECWIKPAALADAQPLAEWNSGDQFGVHLWISQTPPYGGGSGSINVNLVDTAGLFHTLTTGAGILNTNGFQHVALSYDKASGMTSLYCNGTLLAAGTLGSFTPQTSFGLYLGKRVSDASSAAFRGLMDEASLYGRALTAAEIHAIYSADGAGKCSLGTAPSITTQPAGQTVLAGATATFSVVAAGSSPLSYQWRFAGTNLAGATSTALTLTNVQLAQSGSYTVQITNLYGSATSSNAVLTVNPVLSCVPPPSGLIGWWRAENSAVDAVGGHNGTATNGVSFLSGRVGQAFQFNGTNSYVQVADSPSLRLTNELTIEFWVKRQDLNASDVIINKGGDRTGNTANYGVAISSTQADIGSKLGFIFAGGTRCSAGILDLNWHHVAVVARNGDVDAAIYVDGVQQPIIIRQGPATINLYPSTWPLTIGAQIDPASGWYYYSSAMVDELSIYNRALTATEIQAIYNADGAGKCLSGTAPSITAQPTNQVASVGGSLSFTVAATGTAPLSYQWRFAGTNLAGATSTALTLANVQLAQAGSYTVQVTNLYGSATSSNAVLTVTPVLSCVPPPSGLVSWWLAEGNALDSVGTNNGVLVNGAGFGAGEVGQAFSFDGATQRITVPYSRSLATTNYSVEAWVKPRTQVSDSLNQEQIIGQAYGWQLVVRPGTSGISVVFMFATSTSTYYNVVSTTELPIGQFSHVVGTWDGTTLGLYFNGVLNAQKVPGAKPADSGYDIYIGGSQAGGAAVQCFNGLIDEASYYSRALSAAEIQTLYTAGSAGKCQTPVPPSIQASPQNQAVPPGATASFVVVAAGTSPLSYQWRFNGAGIAGATSSVLTLTNVQLANVGTYAVTVTNLYGSTNSAGSTLTLLGSGACTPPPAGLVSWWTAEGTSADAAGTNNGVLVSGAGFGAGMVGQAFSFDGATQRITVPYSRSLATTNYSVEAWVKPRAQVSDSLNQEQIIGQAYGWQLVVRPGTSGISVVFMFATSTSTYYNVVSTTELPIGQFSHVVGTWDGTTLGLYFNGVLNAQKVPGAKPADSGYDIYIGGSQAGGAAVQCFNGLIDEASYYSRALSAAEIQALYTAGSAGKCHTLVSPTIQTPPQSQTVVLGTNASFSVVAGGFSPLSYQWHFNGLAVAGATSSVLTLTNVQLTSAGAYDVTVTNLYGATNSSAATLTVLIQPAITAQPQDQTVRVGSNATFSVVATGSGPLSYQWYFNGVALSGATSTNLALSGVSISQAGTYGVTVSNQVGSVNSRSAILVVQQNGACAPPPSGLVSWWMAEGNAVDSVGTNNGVLFGAGFGAGMVGQAFSFDGATQAVLIPYTRSLLTTNYSTEAWVKPLTQVSDPGNQEQIMGQAGGWQLVVRPGASGVSVAFLFATSTGSFPGVVSTSELPIGQFSHVVGSWDGTTLRLYINGVLSAQAVPGGTPVDSGRELHIGGSRDGSTPVQCFHGLIDEASYYNRALSAAEVQALYTAGSGGKCQTPIPPSIQAAPQNQAVPPGGTASFVVVAAGTSPLSYQWHFNGAGIAGATSPVLTMTNVQLASVGTYAVTVTNLYGSTNSAGATLTLLGSGVCTPPPAGLVSWWTAEGTAADVVGTNNGVLFGAGFGVGMVGQAFSFDGATQAVFIPYTRSLLTTNYSTEAWVKPLSQVSDPGNQEQIMGQAGGWQLVVRTGASGVSVAFLFATSTGSFPSVVSTSELPIGQFSHVVGSWDGATLRLYINGVLSAQAVPGATPVDSGRELHIGGSRDGSTPVQCFHGLIDEASYYNRALNASEVQTLYAAGSMGKCQTSVSPSIQAAPQNQAVPPGGTASFIVVAAGTSPLSYQWHFNGAGIAGATSSVLTVTNVQLANVGTYAVTVTNLYGSANSAGATLTLLGSGACTPAPAGLVSWWTADGTAADVVGTNNGVLVNGAGFAAGMVGQAFSFDGATQAVFIPYTRSLLTTNYSAEAWVKPLSQVSDPVNQEQIMGQAGGWQLVVRPGASGVSVAFLFATSTGGFPSVVSTSELPLGQFSHVVGSWDGTTLRLFINGVLSAQAVPGGTPVDSGRELHIGGSRDGSTPVQCFHGLIDEASYYSRALSAAEIQTLYAAGSMGKCPTQVPPSVQTYQFSMPIRGAITLGALDWGNWTTTTCTNRIVVDSSCASVLNFCGVLLNFQSLTETVVFDPVNLTLRQFGMISVTPSASQLLIHEYDPSSPSRTADIAIQYSSLPSGLPFDTGVRPLNYDAIRKVYTCDGSLIPEPVNIRGSYSIVTSNENRSGTIDYALSRYPSPYADIFVTFNTLSLSNYPASLSLSGAGEGDQCSPPGFIASPQLITDFTATNGFHALLYAGGVNWFGNKAEEGVWAVGPITATNAGPVVLPIVITVQPQDQTVGVGSNATFSVVAIGSGPLSYQWYFNGAPLSGATSASLVLSGVSLNQAGNYGVTVSNLVGSVNSRSALLVVLGKGACTPPPAGLVSWWTAEGTAADAIGTNNGVLFGAGFGAGEVGQAFAFDGATQAVFIPYTRSLLTTNYSAEAWVKPLSQVSDPINQEQIMGQAGGWQLVVRPGASGVMVAFLFATSTGSFPAVVSTSELPIGQCSHVVGSWDGTTLRLYINGVLSAQAEPGRAPVDSGRELHIGGSRDGSTPVQCFHGLIDEAGYYSRALSAAEIQTLYAAGSAGKCQTPVPPSIQASPQNQAVPPGGTVSFTVIAAGTSPLSYQWHFNGAGIAGAMSSMLTLTNVQHASVGTYAVTVTNLYGSANSAGALLTLLGSGACTPSPAGLVSWWKAEGTAADLVGTNNGVLFGAGFGAGMVGQTFSFDGATQAVFIPYTRSLLTTNYSAEAWVKPLTQVSDPINQEQIIGQAGGWQLVVRPGASGVSVAFLFATSKGGFPGVVSTSELPIGQFSHVVGSWDGTTLRLYINGALNAQSVPGATPVDSGRELHIGGSRDGSTPVQCFHGLIDEAGYYSRALSASEIQAIYNAGDAGKCPVGVAPSILTQPASQTVSAGGNAAFSVTVAGTPPLIYQWQFSGTNIPGATGTSLALSNVQSAQAGNYNLRVTNAYGSAISSNAVLTVNQASGCATTPAGLVAWWPGQGNANDAADGHNGTLHGGVTFTPGEVGQAFSFNGSNSYVEVPDSPALRLTNELSIEFWVKRQNLQDEDYIINKGGDYTQGLLNYGVTITRPEWGGTLAFTFAGGARHSLSITDLNWHHCAVTARNGDVDPSFYVDGVQRSVTLRQGAPTIELFASTAALDIGAQVDPASGWFLYSGALVDEMGLYNRTLTAAEIQAIYRAGSAGKCPSGMAPSILTQPASQAVSAGGNAAFSVTVAGTPPLSYQWQLSGTNIPGATGTSLALSNVQSAQAGSYAVRVTNAFGAIMSSNALLTIISSPTCATPPSGLVSWWRAEASASDGVDSNNGTLLNGASFASGMVGQAFSFNGSNQCVQVPHAASLVASNYSIEAWVKPLAQVSDPIDQDLIFGQTFGHCQLLARTGSTGVRLAFAFGTSHYSFYEATGTSEIPIGQFSHLAGTWDGTTLRLYINGVLNAQSTPHAAPVDSGCSFYLGGFYSPTDDSCGYVGQFFNGLIDEASYYKRALSGAEIQSIYNAGGAGKCPNLRQLPRLRLQVSLNPDGTTRLHFLGSNSQSYRIEVSPDMLNWVSLGICTADAEGNVEFTDPSVEKQPLGFYRAVEQ